MGFIQYLNENVKREFPRIARKIRYIEQTYEVCPHCNEEIKEKEMFYDGEYWYHRPCKNKGPVRLSKESEECAKEWKDKFGLSEGAFTGSRSPLRSAIKSARKVLKDIAKKFDVNAKDIVRELYVKF